MEKEKIERNKRKYRGKTGSKMEDNAKNQDECPVFIPETPEAKLKKEQQKKIIKRRVKIKVLEKTRYTIKEPCRGQQYGKIKNALTLI